MTPTFYVTLMINKLLVSVLLFGSLTACASGPATGNEGFEMRRTGLAAGGEFLSKYFFNRDVSDPYASEASRSALSAPGMANAKTQDSFYASTYSHREYTAPIYDSKARQYFFANKWVLSYDNSPYGSAD
jgi:hypothetical protein